MSAKKDTLATTAARIAQAKRDADKAAKDAGSTEWQGRAIHAVLSYARTDAQTADVARTLYAATKHGVSLSVLADAIATAARESDVQASGFSRARIGQLTNAVKLTIGAGVDVPETGTIDPVVATLLARMVTAVSGSSSGIPSDVLKGIIAATVEHPGADLAQSLSNNVDAEIAPESEGGHELTKAYREANKKPRVDPDEPVDVPLSATAIVAMLGRFRQLLAEGKYDAGERASIHGAINDALATLSGYARNEARQSDDVYLITELPALSEREPALV